MINHKNNNKTAYLGTLQDEGLPHSPPPASVLQRAARVILCLRIFLFIFHQITGLPFLVASLRAHSVDLVRGPPVAVVVVVFVCDQAGLAWLNMPAIAPPKHWVVCR